MRGLALAGVAVSLLAGCGSKDGADATSGSSAAGATGAEQVCVDTINMYRATLGLAPYARWTDAETCASSQAESDSMSGTAHGAFGMCAENAQNECPNWPGPPEKMIPDCLMMMWGEGPGSDFSKHGHYINMSSTSYTKVSCGFFVLSGGSVWAAQDFQ